MGSNVGPTVNSPTTNTTPGLLRLPAEVRLHINEDILLDSPIPSPKEFSDLSLLHVCHLIPRKTPPTYNTRPETTVATSQLKLATPSHSCNKSIEASILDNEELYTGDDPHKKKIELEQMRIQFDEFSSIVRFRALEVPG